ncbi:MAG: D-2-hydroxyacid dehydrogenase family protein [Chloroflexi bacterium]|nr:D-2-hydroxyacid dehydrogenase family protein [Chloroflexota bacterium]
MAERKRVVVLEDWNAFFPGAPSLERLRERVDIDIHQDVPADAADLVARLRDAHIVVLNRERTRFDAATIAALPALELIVQTGGVSPNLDLAAATTRGVAVATAPGLPGSIDGVAELALGLLLSLARRIPAHDRDVRAGRWAVAPTTMLAGGTMGIVGLGRLGSSLARLGQALRMSVIAAGPTLTPARAAAAGVAFATLHEVFAQADAVFICTRLSDRTRGLVTRAHLERMKPTAYLINVARGPIVDEAALVDLLRAGRIAGAELDVFDREPLPLDHPLIGLDNVVLTPHIGWVTATNTARFVESVVAAIERHLDGE